MAWGLCWELARREAHAHAVPVKCLQRRLSPFPLGGAKVDKGKCFAREMHSALFIYRCRQCFQYSSNGKYCELESSLEGRSCVPFLQMARTKQRARKSPGVLSEFSQMLAPPCIQPRASFWALGGVAAPSRGCREGRWRADLKT